MDRAQLFNALSKLPPQDFERLLVGMNMPRMNRAGTSAKIGEQVSAFLEWADSNIGPGLEAIARHLAELNHFEFDTYLQTIIATYEKWWEHYTLTDAVGEVEQPQPEQPSIFDFGLMVQTVAKEKDEANPPQEKQEKTERLPVLEGIRKYADGHVLLVGRPGSGKSTALIRLVLEVATETLKEGQGQIPILVELRYWQTSVIERIQAFLHQHDPALSLDNAALTTLLRQGRFLLLIDGLNELPSDEARTQLATFRRDHPKVPMIFTTRDLGLGGDLGIEKKLKMQPLTEAQMKDFIRAYVPDQAEAMLRQLSDRLREFGQTPLLLWMLCEVFQQSPNRQIPTNLAEVFRAFTTMYEDSSVRKHEVALLKGDVRALSARRLWKEALMALAARMMQGETPVDFRVAIHRTEAARELSKIFAKEAFPARDILDDLLKYHLLQNRTTNQLEFRHQLIQEYYAAEHLLDLLPELSDEQLKRDYLNLLKWTGAIALMLSLVDKEAQALRVVKLAIDNVDLMLGARLAGEVKVPLQSQTIGWIDALEIPIGLKVDCWTASHSEAAISGLLTALKAPDPVIRREAVKGFGQIRSEAAVDSLLGVLEDPDFYVRKLAASALEQPNSEVAIPDWFIDLKVDDLWERLRQLPIPSLLDALDDPDHLVRWRASDVLVEVGREEVVPGLLNALEHHRDSNVRWRVAKALGRIGSKAAIPGLLNALKATNFIVRENVVEALGQLGSEAAIPYLLDVLKEDPSTDVRRFAAQSLGQLGSEAAIPGLLNSLKDPILDVRYSAVDAIGCLSNVVAIPCLQKALEDSEDAGVRWRSAEALGRLGSEAVIPSLLRALDDPVIEVRWRTAEALGCLGEALRHLENKEVSLGLLKALGDPDIGVRWQSAEALGKIGSPLSLANIWQLQLQQPAYSFAEAISSIQIYCKFYNHKIWQATVEAQNANKENVEAKPGQTSNVFPNATEVKIFERVEHYHEHPPDSNP